MERRYSVGSDNHYEEHRPILIANYRRSFLGRIRTLANIQRIEWYFVLFSFAIISIGFFFTCARMIALNFGSDQFLVCILVVINLTFSAYYLVHSILQEQPFEILAYIFTTLIIAVFVTINFSSSDVDDYALRVMRFMITIILSIPNIALAVKIGRRYWQSGTFIFKTVGGDMGLQRICRIYLFGQSLLIFDTQAMLSCAIIVIQDGFSGMTNEQTYMFITGIIFAFIWLFVGYAAMRTENAPITWIFAVISIVQPLFVLYLIVQGLDQVDKQFNIRTNSAYFIGFVLLGSHFTLLAFLPTIKTNYGKGLKEIIYGVEPRPVDFRRNIVIVPYRTHVHHHHHHDDEILPADGE